VKPKDPIPKETGGALGVYFAGGGQNENAAGVVDKRGVNVPLAPALRGCRALGERGRQALGQRMRGRSSQD
jgi:hypothetical protein